MIFQRVSVHLSGKGLMTTGYAAASRAAFVTRPYQHRVEIGKAFLNASIPSNMPRSESDRTDPRRLPYENPAEQGQKKSLHIYPA